MKTLKTFCGLQPGHFSFTILRDVDLTFLYQEKYVNSKNIFLRFTALFSNFYSYNGLNTRSNLGYNGSINV